MTKTVPSAETEAPIQLGDIHAMFSFAKRRALECLVGIIEEPYSGEEHHDPALRKAKVAAAIALLGVDPNQAFKLRLGDAALSKCPAGSILLASGMHRTANEARA